MAENRNQGFAALLRQTVVPVVTIEDPAKAVPLARALSDGGPVSYTHLTLPTTCNLCRSRWSPCE